MKGPLWTLALCIAFALFVNAVASAKGDDIPDAKCQGSTP